MRFVTIVTSLALLGGSLITAWAGNLIPHKVKAKKRCSLGSSYRYQATNATPVSSITYAVLNLTDAEVDLSSNSLTTEPVITKIYQQSASSMNLNHCAISNTAVMLQENGSWSINLRATQDPKLVPNTQRPIFQRFRRNKFYVTFRGLGSVSGTTSPESDDLGRPVLFEQKLEGFWVEQGQTRYLFEQSKKKDLRIKDFYNHISRVELLFHYE
ncbi:hypothetical protein [Gimesia fumaroli]|uniref:Uncharacterized protein n=1 Tax=Gimesia fumaroli TaxID=2527976 RepID=A0A518IGI4_9PLAN|nr:hypothetical protein [Gimesia fumaroli]QDV52203.1 hypothetical protein Enr17x_42630 [Gimesia fumaroli]